MSKEDYVPVRSLLQTPRTREIREKFLKVYGKKSDFLVRVPGRVNLIGEHVDYCGYSVCPMALEQDILLAVSVEEDHLLYLHNIDSSYQDFQCDMSNFEISVGEGAPQWYQYFLCGVKGILNILPKEKDIKGMKIVVSGTIPQSAGLSSSSALVSVAALATAYALKLSLTKDKMACLCADCERYIGTQGGGMDQAIAFLAKEGCAKLIDFNPLRSSDVALPTGAVFVIAHSLSNMNKAATADFNCRVVECRLAAQIMAKERGIDWKSVCRLGDLQKALGLDLVEMVHLTEEILHEVPYTKTEIVEKLETTFEDLNKISLTPNTRSILSFKLKQRAMHVFQEALRVRNFLMACSSLSGEATSATLGRLMNESHESLRDLYECSHPELDALVEISKGLALGARLTGAGWGGCIVALLEKDNVEKYLEFLKENFYKQRGVFENLDKLVFSTEPKAGACVYLEE